MWALLILALLTACDRSPVAARAPEINTALPVEPRSLDPALSESTYSQIVVRQIFDTLLDYDPNGPLTALRPRLAKTLPTVSADGLTLTLKLETGARFSDGTPLTTEDAAFSLSRLVDPKTHSPFRAVLAKSLASARTSDAGTLEIHLAHPSPRFALWLAHPALSIVSKKLVTLNETNFGRSPIGSGPFALEEWISGQKLTLKKNKTYFRTDLPKTERLRFWIYSESQTAWLRFLQGDLDFGGIPKEVFPTLFQPNGLLAEPYRSKKMIVDRTPVLDVTYLGFNMADRLLSSRPELRRAISEAINRERLISLLFAGRAEVAVRPVPPALLTDPNKSPFAPTYDVQKAKSDLSKTKSIPPLRFDIVSSPFQRQLAEAIAQDLSAIGLKIDIQSWSLPQLEQRLHEGKTQLFYLSWEADLPDASDFLQILYGKSAGDGPNMTHFRNSEYDRLFEEIVRLPDGPARSDVIGKMLEIWAKELPLLPIAHRTSVTLRQPWIMGPPPHPLIGRSYEAFEVKR